MGYNLRKINDDVFALLARVLLAVPGSRLVVRVTHPRQPSVRQNLVARLEAHGVDEARWLIALFVRRSEYLAPYPTVGIALDPFPCQSRSRFA